MRNQVPPSLLAAMPFFAGPKALSTLGDKTSTFNTLREIYKEALSPKAVVEITPFVESCITRRAQSWDQMAKKGEVCNAIGRLIRERGLLMHLG